MHALGAVGRTSSVGSIFFESMSFAGILYSAPSRLAGITGPKLYVFPH